MKRVNKIYNSSKYRKELVYICEDEKDRIYCRHNLEHFLDVARIAYMLNLEGELGYDKELIYAIGLLHDIGRHMEYTKGINHHKASADMARNILVEADYKEDEIEIICDAIMSHRNRTNKNKLNEIIYTADKLSRKCFSCGAVETCKWSSSKMNKKIKY